MPSFNDVASGDDVNSSVIQQIIDVLKGTAGAGNIPVSLTAVNDATNYAVDVKNADATNNRSFRAQDSSGGSRLQVSSGTPLADPDGTGVATIVTISHAQTVLNKTISSGTKITLGSDATGDIWYRNSSGELTRRAIGSSGYVLESTGGLPAWRAAATPGHNVWIDAGAFEFSTASFPQTDKWTSTNWPVRVLRYDASSQEDAYAKFRIPTSTPVAAVTAKIHWHTTAAGGAGSSQVMWTLAYLSRASGEAIDTAPTQTDSTNGIVLSTAGDQTITSLALSSVANFAAGEEVYLKLSRSASNSSDTFGSDALLHGLEIEFRA